MIEESGLTPMTMEYACLEAGRYGVFLSLLEKKIASVGFLPECGNGFPEIFSLLYALLPHTKKREEILSRVPSWAVQVYDKRTIQDDDDRLYVYPLSIRSGADNRLDMALLYIALEYGYTNNEEDPITHLSYLLSIRDTLLPYVESGYALSPQYHDIEVEVASFLDSTSPDDLNGVLSRLQTPIEEVRTYLANIPN